MFRLLIVKWWILVKSNCHDISGTCSYKSLTFEHPIALLCLCQIVDLIFLYLFIYFLFFFFLLFFFFFVGHVRAVKNSSQ